MQRIEHCTAEQAQASHPAPAGYRWVTVLSDDACDYCRDGVYVGYDHLECCAAELRRSDDVRY